jgi:aspartate oxidase
MIVIAALQRQESRGAHFRTDMPVSMASYEKRLPLTLGAALHTARAIAQPSPGARRA